MDVSAKGPEQILRLLILEDQPVDAMLIERELRQNGLLFEVDRVDTKEAFITALDRKPIDVILADYRLPGFNGIAALKIVSEKYHDVPFIFVSGTIGEDLAIETLRNGATDYILKDKLKALYPAITRALREKSEADERKRSEQALKESEARFRRLVLEVKDYAIFRLNKDGIITSWNEGIEQILGYKEHEIVGKHFHMLYPKNKKSKESFQEAMKETAGCGRTFEEALHLHKDGSTFYATKAITLLHDKEGNIDGFSVVLHDITERKFTEATIRYQAFHDMLTGLPNRKSMEEGFVLSRESALRQNGKMALMFLDLDRFKTINDTLGHHTGDAILKTIAVRLKHAMREEDIVSRWGGDEFVILARDIPSESVLTTIVTKLLSSIKEPLHIEHHEFHLSTSIGIAIFPDDGKEIDTLLQNADVALYRAKHEGRDRYRMYDPDMNARFHEKLRMENNLRHAITRGELSPFYQAIVDADGTLVGTETLIRWKHPELGFLTPDRFIAIAEESGLIVSIGKWVLQKALEQYAEWLAKGIAPHKISVNVSSRQFCEQTFVQDVRAALERNKIDPKYLDLEITETIVMEDTPVEREKLHELRSLNISLSIDDFGMGYSSLDYLKRFPVTQIKIDKSFVDHSLSNKADASIVNAIIAIAHGLGMEVTAEGVETKEQFVFLSSLGCDAFQGYYFSKPLPAEEFSVWLIEHKTKRALPLV
jgi:diguanylate cyclase (GGDEF)-like protein/PAS domain S-box-containing protein